MCNFSLVRIRPLYRDTEEGNCDSPTQAAFSNQQSQSSITAYNRKSYDTSNSNASIIGSINVKVYSRRRDSLAAASSDICVFGN
jgi:hypothetical protein